MLNGDLETPRPPVVTLLHPLAPGNVWGCASAGHSGPAGDGAAGAGGHVRGGHAQEAVPGQAHQDVYNLFRLIAWAKLRQLPAMRPIVDRKTNSPSCPTGRTPAANGPGPGSMPDLGLLAFCMRLVSLAPARPILSTLAPANAAAGLTVYVHAHPDWNVLQLLRSRGVEHQVQLSYYEVRVWVRGGARVGGRDAGSMKPPGCCRARMDRTLLIFLILRMAFSQPPLGSCRTLHLRPHSPTCPDRYNAPNRAAAVRSCPACVTAPMLAMPPLLVRQVYENRVYDLLQSARAGRRQAQALPIQVVGATCCIPGLLRVRHWGLYGTAPGALAAREARAPGLPEPRARAWAAKQLPEYGHGSTRGLGAAVH